MEPFHKIVWAEGLFLGQQHFQQWDQYHERMRELMLRSLHPLHWGWLDLQIDTGALRSGRFHLKRGLALFPDGRFISQDAAVDPPLTCQLDGRGGEVLDIHLCIPANYHVEGLAGYPGRGHLSGWRADYREIPDNYDPTRMREVQFARPNLMLLTGQDERDSFLSIPVGKVLNEGDGSYHLLDDFIPPVIRVGAAPRLASLLDGATELVGARLRALRERRKTLAGGPEELCRAEPLQFHLLQILSATYPMLRHLQAHPELHPEVLYRHLAGLLGGLSALTREDECDLPGYRHDRLDETFLMLIQQLESSIDVSPTATFPSMSLERESESLWCVQGVPTEIFQRSSVFLEVDFKAGDLSWIADFARQTKVGPRGKIELMVASALQGVLLQHVQRPPTRLSVRGGCEYFRLEPRGDFWSAIVDEGSLAIFVSQRFVDVRMTLVTVKE
jgi:type VI secretion system protein ImpJ